MSKFYSIVKNERCLEICTSLRGAKDKARAVHATYIVEFEQDLTLGLQKLQFNQVFVYNGACGIYEKWSCEGFLRAKPYSRWTHWDARLLQQCAESANLHG